LSDHDNKVFYVDKDYAQKIASVAVNAGAIIIKYFQSAPEIMNKADGSPVTMADKEADVYINTMLMEIAPEIPVISEESVSRPDVSTSQLFWLVDPLDGTRGFTKGDKNFTVNIGLIENNYPVLGVIFAPVDGDLWIGFPDSNLYHGRYYLNAEGAYVSAGGEWLRKESFAKVAKNIGLVGSSTAKMEKIWIQENHPDCELVSVPSSIKFCTLANKEALVYARMHPTYEWDTAAGQGILEAAGGRVLNADGQRFKYGKADFYNGNFFAYANAALANPEA